CVCVLFPLSHNHMKNTACSAHTTACVYSHDSSDKVCSLMGNAEHIGNTGNIYRRSLGATGFTALGNAEGHLFTPPELVVSDCNIPICAASFVKQEAHLITTTRNLIARINQGAGYRTTEKTIVCTADGRAFVFAQITPIKQVAKKQGKAGSLLAEPRSDQWLVGTA
ncbi:hypothetical protein BaRGS_00018323, partial [Batillaria attramentaria]